MTLFSPFVLLGFEELNFFFTYLLENEQNKKIVIISTHLVVQNVKLYTTTDDTIML